MNAVWNIYSFTIPSIYLFQVTLKVLGEPPNVLSTDEKVEVKLIKNN